MTNLMLIHDLKSPIAALDTLFFSLADRLNQEEVDLAQVALTRIKDKFKLLKNGNEDKEEAVDIIKLIEEVVAEKRFFLWEERLISSFNKQKPSFKK